MVEDTRLKAIITAYRRGWTQEQIAHAAGVTYQAIQQMIWKYESRFGVIEDRRERPFRFRSYKEFWKCPQCGRSFVSRWHGKFCSRVCASLANKEITDEMVEEAIRMRHDGETWLAIAQQLDCSYYQSIQLQIWKYLYTRGELNGETIKAIWRRHRGVKGGCSWSWIENTLGLYLQPDGTILEGQPRNRDRSSYGAWGRGQRKGMKQTDLVE